MWHRIHISTHFYKCVAVFSPVSLSSPSKMARNATVGSKSPKQLKNLLSIVAAFRVGQEQKLFGKHSSY